MHPLLTAKEKASLKLCEAQLRGFVNEVEAGELSAGRFDSILNELSGIVAILDTLPISHNARVWRTIGSIADGSLLNRSRNFRVPTQSTTEHVKRGAGLCPICGHYGDDCTGRAA
jgi:hypothetical protein